MVWNLVAGKCQSVTPKKSFATFVKPIITLLLAPKIKMRETFWTHRGVTRNKLKLN